MIDLKVLAAIPWFLFMSATAGAVTDVCGTVAAGEVWSINDSPVKVNCDLEIAELTIEPGVVVQMTGNYEIVVSGVLRALGTEALPVVFRPAEDNTAGWKGLYFEDTVAGSEFVWTEIEGATDSGVHLVRSSLSFDSVTFRGNSATYGGAIRANLSDSDLRIKNSRFVDNFASTAGGAVYMTGPTEPNGAALEVSNTLFLRNHAGTTSTQQHTAGGAIYVNGNARVYGSTFRENEARAYTIFVSGGRYTQGGALYLAGGRSEVGETLFIGNGCRMGAHSQTPDASRAHGGALNVASGELILSNSLLAQNFLTVARNADYRGGGLYVGGGEASIVNTTMTRNSSHAVYRGGGEVNILNSILFFNNNGGTQIAGGMTATYSDIQNGYEGEGNIGLNPIFDDRFGIVSPSPAIDAGSPETEFRDMIPPGKGGVRNDMGHTGGPAASHWKNPVCYRDADGDGHGDPNDFAWMLNCSFDYVPDGDDCDDTDPGITPEPGRSCHAPGVCGLIETAHWLTEESPVSVSCDLNIAELTIEPGVVVRMNGDYKIVVSGVLRSLGTKEMPVVLRPAEENTAGWKGLYFEDTVAGSEFVWTEIEGATDSGVQLVRSSPSFDSVTFRGNSATHGGAIRANLSDSDLRIINSQFVDNFASTAGGAVYMTGPTEPNGAALDISNTFFLYNHAGTTSTQQHTAGGAIYVNGNARVYGSTFRENEARAYTIFVSGGRYTQGGALYLAGGRSEVDETLFIGNGCRMGAHSQTPDASRAHGGALNVASGELILSNSLLAQNFLTVARNADYRGGGLYVGEGKASIVNTTMTRNSSHAVYRGSGEVNILNSILFFNNNGGTQIAGAMTATYSDIQNGYAGEGNIFESPIFRETVGEPELHLASGSPGIDSGTCLNAPNKDIDGDLRPNGAGCDMGADEYVVQDNSILLTRGLNLFSFSTIVPGEYTDCAVLIEALGGPEIVISMTRYDSVSGSFQTCDVEGEPFDIETGVGYQIDLLADRSLPVTSDSVCTPTILEPGLNLLGLPAPPDDLTCFGLLDTWGEDVVTAIQRYDPTSGRFETCAFVTHGDSIPKPGGIDFPIRSREGYMLYSMYQGIIPLPGCDD